MTTHRLKTAPSFFEAVWTGQKTFEVRFDDRGYQRGDTVILREWDRRTPCDCGTVAHEDTCLRYTGREVVADVGHVLASTPPNGSQRGFWGHGYVVFSLCSPQLLDHRAAATVHRPTPLLMARREATS